jgi:signal transduction histidine kinase
MREAKPDLSRLSELASALGPHEHLCLIYNTQEEQFAAALPFLRVGLERRERCLYVADENRADAVLQALRKSGTDVDRYLRSGQIIMPGKQETYLKQGSFDPDWMIRFLSQITQEASDGKFSGLRTILGEMTWALDEDLAPASLIEYEAKLNLFVRDNNVRLLCQYNRNRFSPELILNVIRTHPVVVYGGITCENPYYVPPDEFLKPNQASREVERYLEYIQAWQLLYDQLRALAAQLQTAQETERKGLARELHDEIGQLLTGLRLLLKLNGYSPDVLKTRFEQARTIVDDLLARVRRLSFDLRPADLDQLGLLAALLSLFERYTAQTGVLVDFRHQGVDRRFASEVETVAYRSVQEALTNAARHAGVAAVTVRVWTDPDELNLHIEDRGCGFDPEVVLKAPRSSGLIGMRERIMLLSGRMAIESSQGAGTTITAELPINQTTAT